MSRTSMGGSSEASCARTRSGQPTPRMHFTLDEKLRIVSEALGEGVRQAHITRKYGLGKNTLARWKELLAPLCVVAAAAPSDKSDGELERLLMRVAELERLLGQRTLELDGLRQRLQHNRTMTGGNALAAFSPSDGLGRR